MALTTADTCIPADKSAENLELISDSQDTALTMLGDAVSSDLVANNQLDESSDTEQPQSSDQQESQPDDASQTPGPSAQQQNQANTSIDDETLNYPAINFNFDAPPEGASNARDLSPKDWRLVMETNSLLYGFHIRENNQDVVRARRQAFVLHSSDPKSKARPYFQVEDGASIQVCETKNAFQRSLAQNAFSKRCIESNLSIGDFGVMAGLSGERKREKTVGESSERTTRDQEYYAVFNFPRARLLLDEEELHLSKDCEVALLEIKNDPSYERLQRFYKLFGHVFVTSVLLGGQQKTSKFAAALSIKDEGLQQDALRNAVGAKINAPYVASSLQISKDKENSESRGDQQYTNLSYLGMSATGGNTLIGSDIPKWVQTVAPFKNWRVIENEIAEPIHELIGKIREWEYIPELFKNITSAREKSVERPWRRRMSFLMDGQPLCWGFQNERLRLYPSKEPNTHKAIFVVPSFQPFSFQADSREVLDEMVRQGAIPNSKLLQDFPIILETDSKIGPVPHVKQGPLIADSKYGSRADLVHENFVPTIPRSICRFSLRLAGQSGAWEPNPPRAFKSGDLVNLYCHSLGLGPFMAPTPRGRFPLYASPAVYTPADGQITFPYPFSNPTDMTRYLIKAYDSGELLPLDIEAFEKMGIISTLDFAPGPHVETKTTSKQISIGWQGTSTVPGVSAGVSTKVDNSTEYSVVGGKKGRIDYKKLQQEPYKSADLDWSRCQKQVYDDMMGTMKPVTLTIVFE